MIFVAFLEIVKRTFIKQKHTFSMKLVTQVYAISLCYCEISLSLAT